MKLTTFLTQANQMLIICAMEWEAYNQNEILLNDYNYHINNTTEAFATKVRGNYNYANIILNTI